MKQTAVEWLFDNLLFAPISRQDVRYNERKFNQAKEMEKEHIINAFEIGYENGAGVNEGDGIHYGSNYYNKKFNK